MSLNSATTACVFCRPSGDSMLEMAAVGPQPSKMQHVAGRIMGRTAVATPHRPGGSSGTTQTMMHLPRGGRGTTQMMMHHRHGGSGMIQTMMHPRHGGSGTTLMVTPPRPDGSDTTQTMTPPRHGGIGLMQVVVRHQHGAGSSTVQMTVTHRPPDEQQGQAHASAAPLQTSARRASAPSQHQQLHYRRRGDSACSALPAVQA